MISVFDTAFSSDYLLIQNRKLSQKFEVVYFINPILPISLRLLDRFAVFDAAYSSVSKRGVFKFFKNIASHNTVDETFLDSLTVSYCLFIALSISKTLTNKAEFAFIIVPHESIFSMPVGV